VASKAQRKLVMPVLNRPAKTPTQGGALGNALRRRAKALLLPVRGWALRRLTRESVQTITARGLTPVSRKFGLDRGQPIDRYYIDNFLRRQSGVDEYSNGDITGHVLEIADDRYTKQFGRRVEKLDIFNFSDAGPQVTIMGDLTREGDVPEGTFDCIVCTQTLLIIYDFRAAIRNLQRALKPGGVLLMTNPGISRVVRPDADFWGDYWRFTTLSMRHLLEEVFPPENVRVEAYGNVLSASAALYGLAASELTKDELDLRDPDYEVIIGARAVRPTTD
jgi:SAM-dependent methyltransferase